MEGLHGVKIATWNVNSVRFRQKLVTRFLTQEQPDVLCLQETKVENGLFPALPFHKLGYVHQAIHGQKAYHGVAVLSKIPFRETRVQDFCREGHARHMGVTLQNGVELHNFYVPAGGDIPDPNKNPKFDHKLHFLRCMEKFFARKTKSDPVVLVGDLNVAPQENDVWSHKQLLKVVSHTPIETEKLLAAQTHGEWFDVARERIPLSEKVYTWWSYRAADWTVGDRGRRLDHIWVSRALKDGISDFRITRDARSWERPSDHVPVTVTLEV